MPYTNITRYIEQRTHTVKDGSTVADVPSTDIERMIDQAVHEYSEDEPRRVVTAQTEAQVVDGRFLLTGWDARTDSVLEIENPVDQPRKLTLDEGEDWRVVEETTGVYAIRFYVSPGGNWRLTTLRQWTVDLADVDPVASLRVALLAAAKICRAKATRYADTSDPVIAADGTEYRDKADKWLSLAEALDEEYKASVQRPVETQSPTGQIATADIDIGPFGSRRRSYLVHHRRRR